MEGRLTPEQKEALNDEAVRIALRYVIDEEGMQPWRHAHYSKTMADLAPRLGGKGKVDECVSRILKAGLVDMEKGEHHESIPLADGRGAISYNIVTNLLTLSKKLPDGARLEIGRLLY